MNRLYLDIETAPTNDALVIDYLTSRVEPPSNYKTEDAIEKWWATRGAEKTKEVVDKTALNPAFGRVFAIGIANELGTWFTYKGNEESVLQEFYKSVLEGAELDRPQFVGFNIFNFDLPFLYRRAIVHGNRKLASALRPYVGRWYDRLDNLVVDFMLEWTLGRYGEHISMRELAMALGIEVDMNESGADVLEMYRKGDFAGIDDHLVRDLRILVEIDKAWL